MTPSPMPHVEAALFWQEKYADLAKAVGEVKRTIREKGINPEYHDAVLKKHRAQWFLLWLKLDELVKMVP